MVASLTGGKYGTTLSSQDPSLTTIGGTVLSVKTSTNISKDRYCSRHLEALRCGEYSILLPRVDSKEANEKRNVTRNGEGQRRQQRDKDARDSRGGRGGGSGASAMVN